MCECDTLKVEKNHIKSTANTTTQVVKMIVKSDEI